MVWVVPMARAMFDRCGLALGGGATLPEAPGRGGFRALGLRGVLMVRGVVSGRGQGLSSKEFATVSIASEYLILAAVSAAAGLALGRVISQRLRGFICAGSVAAALLGAGLTWSSSRGMVTETLTVEVVQAALLGVAAVLFPFSPGTSPDRSLSAAGPILSSL